MNLREIRECGTDGKELSARPWGMVSQGNVPEAEWQADKPARDICPAAWTLASKAHGLLHPSRHSSVGIWAGEPTGPSLGFGLWVMMCIGTSPINRPFDITHPSGTCTVGKALKECVLKVLETARSEPCFIPQGPS